MKKSIKIFTIFMILGLTGCETTNVYFSYEDICFGSSHQEKIVETLDYIRKSYGGRYNNKNGLYEFTSTSIYYDSVSKCNVYQDLKFTGDLEFSKSDITAKTSRFKMERNIVLYNNSKTVKSYEDRYNYSNEKYLVERIENKTNTILEQKKVNNFTVDFNIEDEINCYNYSEDFMDGKGKYKFVDLNYKGEVDDKNFVSVIFKYNKNNLYDEKIGSYTFEYGGNKEFSDCSYRVDYVKNDIKSSESGRYIDNIVTNNLRLSSSNSLNNIVVDIDESAEKTSELILNLDLGGKLYEEEL